MLALMQRSISMWLFFAGALLALLFVAVAVRFGFIDDIGKGLIEFFILMPVRFGMAFLQAFGEIDFSKLFD